MFRQYNLLKNLRRIKCTLSDEQKRLLYGFIEEGYKDEDRHDISEETER